MMTFSAVYRAFHMMSEMPAEGQQHNCSEGRRGPPGKGSPPACSPGETFWPHGGGRGKQHRQQLHSPLAWCGCCISSCPHEMLLQPAGSSQPPACQCKGIPPWLPALKPSHPSKNTPCSFPRSLGAAVAAAQGAELTNPLRFHSSTHFLFQRVSPGSPQAPHPPIWPHLLCHTRGPPQAPQSQDAGA